jgi:hypothetical protein
VAGSCFAGYFCVELPLTSREFALEALEALSELHLRMVAFVILLNQRESDLVNVEEKERKGENLAR